MLIIIIIIINVMVILVIIIGVNGPEKPVLALVYCWKLRLPR